MRHVHGRWPDAAEYGEKRFAELSVVNQADNYVLGRAEDCQSQRKQSETAGHLRAAGLSGNFYREKNHFVTQITGLPSKKLAVPIC